MSLEGTRVGIHSCSTFSALSTRRNSRAVFGACGFDSLITIMTLLIFMVSRRRPSSFVLVLAWDAASQQPFTRALIHSPTHPLILPQFFRTLLRNAAIRS